MCFFLDISDKMKSFMLECKIMDVIQQETKVLWTEYGSFWYYNFIEEHNSHFLDVCLGSISLPISPQYNLS